MRYADKVGLVLLSCTKYLIHMLVVFREYFTWQYEPDDKTKYSLFTIITEHS